MHDYTETRILPYTPEQMFRLVVDIEKYPQFLPWCRAARVISREPHAFLGELVVSFGHMTERYTSRVTPIATVNENEWRIDVSLVSGPFNFLSNHWRFTPHPDGCEINLKLDFEFKSKILDKLIGSMFGRACEKMVGAFTARANAIYGNQPA